MPKKIRCPSAEQLYSARDKIAKASLAAALTEARDLAHWAGRRIPNGPTSGALTQGYSICGTGDLDLAIAQIIARVREDTTNSIRHASTRKMARESKVERNRRQLAVRRTGKCDNCGTDFVCDRPGFRPGKAPRTPKQWREAFAKAFASPKPDMPTRTVLVFPGDPDLELRIDETTPAGMRRVPVTGRGEAARYEVPEDEQPWDAGSKAAARIRPTPAQARARKARGTEGVPLVRPMTGRGEAALYGREFVNVPKDSGFNPRGFRARKSEFAKEKIPNHKRSPAGKSRGAPKRKRK